MAKTEDYVSDDQREQCKRDLLRIGDGHVGRDIFHMLVARYKILYIRSCEEDRVLECLKYIGLYDSLDLCRWDVGRGLLSIIGEEKISADSSEVHENPIAVMDYIIDQARSDHQKMEDSRLTTSGRVYVLLDLHHFLEGMPVLERKFKEFSHISSKSCVVIISPVFQCPPSLNKEFTLVDFPLPSVEEIESSFEKICSEIRTEYPEAVKHTDQEKEEIVNAARGLTLVEVENAYAKSLVKFKKFHVPTILDEKKQIIRKSGILDYRDSKVTFDEIGGLDNLKEWLQVRRLAFRKDAHEFGLPSPRGILMLGTPGCGKSLIATALANVYEMPLLRLDMGRIFASHVGESEAHIRDVLQTTEAIAPAILFIDEVEKAIGGVQSSNATDGGVTNRVFGTFLTWMQDNVQPVFVICTANNISGIPPEFLRAGRFDEIFFLDLPNEEQRADVILKLLLKKKRDPCEFDLQLIAELTPHYSPAEIEKAIDNALFVAFANGKRKMTTEDIVSEVGRFQPLYSGRKEEIEAMRESALGKDGRGGIARLANSSESNSNISSSRRGLSLSEDASL